LVVWTESAKITFWNIFHFWCLSLNHVEFEVEPLLEMQVNSFVSRVRMPAVFCAITFMLCEAVSRPFAEMGVCDDWSYIRTAQLLAQTGHIRYNGWAATMVGWQLYPAAALLKLFGFSFTAARLSTFLVAVLTTFLIQRTFVRAGINERNATIGTLAIVLTPLYMALSVTFMTDLPGLFAIVICLYGCLRALQASSSASATRWVCFAALTNTVFGTSRQISWLGVLVMVPCTLWLLRRHRRTLVAGGLATLLSWASIAMSLHWLNRQLYIIPEHLFFKIEGLGQLRHMAKGLGGVVLDVPFLILPIVAAYLIVLRRKDRQFWSVLGVCGLGFAVIFVWLRVAVGPGLILEPILGDWVTPMARYGIFILESPGPIVLGHTIRVLLTAVTGVATLCVIAFLWGIRQRGVRDEIGAQQVEVSRLTASSVSWDQILLLVGPFAVTYFLLLIPRSSVQLLDRYLLAFLVLAGLCLLRAFQDFVQPHLPAVTKVLVGVVAIYSIGATHDMFAFYRARIAVANEVRAAGIQPSAFDGDLEYNGWEELLQGGYVHDRKMVNPPDSDAPMAPYRGWSCTGEGKLYWYFGFRFPHFSPRYGLSFDPDACSGRTALAPVSYFRWLGLRPGYLYVVNYQPAKGPYSLPSNLPPF
jgi:hypothetical protein